MRRPDESRHENKKVSHYYKWSRPVRLMRAELCTSVRVQSSGRRTWMSWAQLLCVQSFGRTKGKSWTPCVGLLRLQPQKSWTSDYRVLPLEFFLSTHPPGDIHSRRRLHSGAEMPGQPEVRWLNSVQLESPLIVRFEFHGSIPVT